MLDFDELVFFAAIYSAIRRRQHGIIYIERDIALIDALYGRCFRFPRYIRYYAHDITVCHLLLKMPAIAVGRSRVRHALSYFARFSSTVSAMLIAAAAASPPSLPKLMGNILYMTLCRIYILASGIWLLGSFQIARKLAQQARSTGRLLLLVASSFHYLTEMPAYSSPPRVSILTKASLSSGRRLSDGGRRAFARRPVVGRLRLATPVPRESCRRGYRACSPAYLIQHSWGTACMSHRVGILAASPRQIRSVQAEFSVVDTISLPHFFRFGSHQLWSCRKPPDSDTYVANTFSAIWLSECATEFLGRYFYIR